MEQISEQISQELLQELPDQVQFFTPDELLSAGFPYIVVETIRKNVASTIGSELHMPESKWVQQEDGNVQQAWQNFMDISIKHLRFPASKLSYILAEAVEQCLELALKPRQAVPELIFRTRDTIDFETAKVRVESLEVNKQLGLALLRYMEKKEKDEITIEQAKELVKKIDERLAENYHPLNWAQVLKPVFEIAGPSVDTELFQIFFDDKEKPVYARKFGQLNDNLNETELIEVLSSADLLDIDEDEDEQPELFVPVEEESEPEKVVEIEKTDEDEKVITPEEEQVVEESDQKDHREIQLEEPEDFEEPEEKTVEQDQPEKKEDFVAEDPTDAEDIDDTEEEEEQDENIVDLFSQIREDDLFEEDKNEQSLSLVEKEDEQDAEDDNITLLSKFKFDDSGEDLLQDDTQDDTETPESSGKENPSSIYEEMNLVKNDLTDVQENKDFFETSPEESEENEEEFSLNIENREKEEVETEQEESTQPEPEAVDSDEEEDDQPMWRSFLERDDLDTDSGYEYDEDSEDESTDEFEEEMDDGFIEEPIYDLTTDDEAPDEKIKKISRWLDDEKDRFIDEIFKGSDAAYEQALLEIMDFQNWKAASMYLEKEVFSRNKVDVYDEAAVDFTDRLHSFFLENNSKQDN
ncbi:MAG: hypothetical protein U5K72_16805 [Balneolaceae bacterium]|nr:hypothetical protein [Balneolaceae bacterium]